MSKTPSYQTAKWFFLIFAVAVIVLFWRMIEPFALVLVTAAIFAIILAPLDEKLRKYIKWKKLSALFMVVLVFLVVLIPVFVAGVLVVQQASEIVSATIADDGFLQSLDVRNTQFFVSLPAPVQEQILSIDFVEAGRNVAEWAFTNIGDVLSGGARLIFQTFIFFVALYYFLVDRERIKKEILDISPFKDKLDASIVHRLVSTVRAVVFGALIVAIIQAIIAAIGMTIFGVPGALLWGLLVIVAAQVPMVGVGLIMVPAVAYLFLTGHPGAAVGLAIWAVTAVGLVDNLLSPYLVGSRTKMPELLVLISILGGLAVFGSIGFIVGPTVLAALLVVVELYKSGILEKGKGAV